MIEHINFTQNAIEEYHINNRLCNFDRTETTLLQTLSRGLFMVEDDINRIVPMLSVFCAMFSHSLYTLHDADFYGETFNGKFIYVFHSLYHISYMKCIFNIQQCFIDITLHSEFIRCCLHLLVFSPFNLFLIEQLDQL